MASEIHHWFLLLENRYTQHTANELVNLIIDLKKAQGQPEAAYPFATGALIAIIDGARNGYYTLQDGIDRNYEAYEQDLAKLQQAAWAVELLRGYTK